VTATHHQTTDATECERRAHRDHSNVGREQNRLPEQPRGTCQNSRHGNQLVIEDKNLLADDYLRHHGHRVKRHERQHDIQRHRPEWETSAQAEAEAERSGQQKSGAPPNLEGRVAAPIDAYANPRRDKAITVGIDDVT
jgi:hypothetical protein